jgi:hypothetical protein
MMCGARVLDHAAQHRIDLLDLKREAVGFWSYGPDLSRSRCALFSLLYWNIFVLTFFFFGWLGAWTGPSGPDLLFTPHIFAIPEYFAPPFSVFDFNYFLAGQ